MDIQLSELQYATICELLQPLRLPVSTSEVHGLLVGYLAAGGIDTQQWLDHTGLSAADGTAVPQDIVQTLYSGTVASLRAEDFSFAPLLPDDGTPIATRVDALVDWCRGFLGGFGLAGPVSQEVMQNDDAQEILRDLAHIAAAGAQPDGDEEQDENALAELEEYVRMGAMLLDAHGQDDGTAEGDDDDQ